MVEEKKLRKQHSIMLDNRKSVVLTGVGEVADFDALHVTASTDYGTVTVRGTALRIGKLSVESGELTVEGEIEAVYYSDDAAPQKGVFSRLFR